MDLKLQSQSVVRICFDNALTIITDEDFEIRIEVESLIRIVNNGQVKFYPGHPENAASYLVQLLGKKISISESTEGGNLIVKFDGGLDLTVDFDAKYEAWEISGPKGWRVVCMPGGGIAVWSGS
ncbi:hypothetical protein GCM10027187_23770 [Streptosporangium sandarakinum]|uniref:Uncharacterized protein n=1 Tax=Streptosporangium sandarakinum TaxID=1260955 RepID=A0A852V7F5_9ACTN|nr:DUF6188 family protein [Streptosporangium sandarakinum]NYF43488.1 hypothetical protein [Streptosporangium sandarakinum]